MGEHPLSRQRTPFYTSHARLLWHYLRPLFPSLTVAIAFAALLALVASIVTTLIGPAMQVITAAADQKLSYESLLGPRIGPWVEALTGTSGTTAGETLHTLPALLIGLAGIRAVLTLVQWYLWERAGEVVSRDIRNDLTQAYLHLDPNIRRSSTARSLEGALSSTITTDVKLLREYITHFYGGLPRELLQVIFLSVTLVLLSPKLTLIFLLGVAPVGVVISRIGKKLRKRASKALSDYSDLSEWLQQRLLGIETIKHFGTEHLEETRMQALTQSLFQRFLGAARIKSRTSPVVEAMAVLAMTIVLVIAMRDVASGQASGAVQMSFFSTLALLSQAAGKLGRYVNSNREGAAAVDRVLRQFSHLAGSTLPVIPRALQYDPEGTTRIVCKNITGQYVEAEAPALKDFSFTFEGGKIYCLAGPSGAGKSTVFNILLGLLSPSKGSIEFFVRDRWERRLSPISYMPQKVLVLADSLGANVAYPEVDWDATCVEQALHHVGLESLYKAWPDGIHTRIGEGGAGLSGGQAQRVLLARLAYHDAPFILVDEGTSALDPETERRIQALLRELAARGHVVITIAHRESAVAAADVTLQLHDGSLLVKMAD
jgi:ABC-type multidrug transport system fused ATPase/permease subunit